MIKFQKKRIVLIGLIGLTIITFFCSLIQWVLPLNQDIPTHIVIREKYDSTLANINSTAKLEILVEQISLEKGYSNSLAIIDSAAYVYTLDSLLQYKFYSNLANYSWSDNYIAAFLGNYIWFGFKSIVIPNDIVKFNRAICNQQAIVFQCLLRQKGFKTRGVGFHGDGFGHYASEVFYNGQFHFFDANLEASYHSCYAIPSIEELVKDSTLLHEVYRSSPMKERIVKAYTNFLLPLEEPNLPIARNATIFQLTSKFLSNTLFIFTGLLAFFVWKKEINKV